MTNFPPNESLKQPETLTSQEVFEAQREVFDGFEILFDESGKNTIAVKRRGLKNANKGMTCDATADGSFLLVAAGTEQKGYGLEEVVVETTRRLLTLTRHMLNPELGESVGKVSKSYKTRSIDMAKEIIELIDCGVSIDRDADEKEEQNYVSMLNETTQSFLNFMYEDVRETVTEDDEQRAVEALANLIKGTTEFSTKMKGQPSA